MIHMGPLESYLIQEPLICTCSINHSLNLQCTLRFFLRADVTFLCAVGLLLRGGRGGGGLETCEIKSSLPVPQG